MDFARPRLHFIPIGWFLRSMTGLSYQRVALALALCFPLHRNLEYGQFYIFLLLLIAAAAAGLWPMPWPAGWSELQRPARSFPCYSSFCSFNARTGGVDSQRAASQGFTCCCLRSGKAVFRMERASHLSPRDPTLDAEWRGDAAICA